MEIPFVSFEATQNSLRREILEAFQQVYNNAFYILGGKLTEFEQAYSLFTGSSHCAGVSNGSDALFLSLKALGIGPGDEVIVPSNGYIAAPFAVSNCGAKPVFAEPDPATANISAPEILRVITQKTKAVIAVHMYGQSCDMDTITELARQNRISVVEDNAHAIGAKHHGLTTGSLGDINATSFYPTKNLGALGDGGAITTTSLSLIESVRALRNYGSVSKNIHNTIGYNMRLDELQAAFLLVKMRYLEEWNKERSRIAQVYSAALAGTGDLILPVTAEGNTHVFHLYVIRTTERNRLRSYLAGHGIQTEVHYPTPPALQPAYRGEGYSKGDFPVAEMLADTSLSLPVWPGMSEEQVMKVCTCVRQFF